MWPMLMVYFALLVSTAPSAAAAVVSAAAAAAVVSAAAAAVVALDQTRDTVFQAQLAGMADFIKDILNTYIEYYAKFPSNIKDAIVLLVDPMLATGGSAVAAVDMLKKRGAKDIRYVGLVGAPEGVKAMQDAHPEVPVYLAAVDEKLNENCYIVPGLGDCGDRLFGTK